jgi:hypothetical protein
MRSDIGPGAIFPNYELPDHTGTPRRLSELAAEDTPVRRSEHHRDSKYRPSLCQEVGDGVWTKTSAGLWANRADGLNASPVHTETNCPATCSLSRRSLRWPNISRTVQ